MKQLVWISILSLKKGMKENVRVMVGMTLCVVLITNIGILGDSFLKSKRDNDINLYGEQAAITKPLTKKQQQEIQGNTFWTRQGYVKTTGVLKRESMELNIPMGYMDAEALSLAHIQLDEGRLPTKKGEIAIEKSLDKQMGLKHDTKIGDQITLEVHSPDMLYMMGEEQTDKVIHRTYTVVGIVKKYSIVRNMQIVNNDEQTPTLYSSLSAFVSEAEVTEANESITNGFLYAEDKNLNAFIENLPEGVSISENHKVYIKELREGIDTVWNKTVQLIAIVVALIVFAMVFFVCSMFLASVDTKRQKFALLRTLGATKLQALIHVLIEGILLSLISSVLGIAAGVALSSGAVELLSRVMSSVTSFPIHLRLNLWSPLAAAGICLVSTLLSGLVPAVKASRTPLIEATAFGRHRRRRRRTDKDKGTNDLNAGYFIRNTLKGSKIRILLYIISMVFCISTVCMVNFYIRKQVANEGSRRYQDFSMGVESFGGSDIFEYEAIRKIGQKEVEEGVIEAIRSVEGVEFIENYLQVVANVILDSSLTSEYTDYVDPGIREYAAASLPNSEGTANKPATGKIDYEYRLLRGVSEYEDKAFDSLKITDGRIDLKALKEGREIVLCLPSFWFLPKPGPAGYGSLAYDHFGHAVPDGAKHYVNKTIKAGDTITFRTNPGDPTKSKLVQVKIGAIAEAGHPMDIITAEGGMDNMEIPYFVCDTNIYMKEKATAQDEEIFEDLSLTHDLYLRSNIDEAEITRNNILFYTYTGGIAGTVLAIIGIAIYLYATVIRIRNKKRDMSMLRTIGMTSRQCIKIFIGEGLLNGLLIGILTPLVIVSVVINQEPDYWKQFLSVPLMAACIAISIALSVLIPYLYGRKMLVKTEIIENITD